MALLNPFRAIRPQPSLAARVAAPPYDVINSAEARRMAAGNPYSFLHVDKPEIDLAPDLDSHDPLVYQTGARNLQHLLSEGVLFQEQQQAYYVYRQTVNHHRQTGLAAVVSVDEYERGVIRKHEFTRPDKEDDRVRHMQALNMQVGPVFLTYRAEQSIDTLITQASSASPVYDFHDADQVHHQLWTVTDPDLITSLMLAFQQVPRLYIADGHHRSAAAARVCQQRRAGASVQQDNQPHDFFLAVVFPHEQLCILDYNRVVKDLGGLDAVTLLARLEQDFLIKPMFQASDAKPAKARDFAMYLAGAWYQLSLRPGIAESLDQVQRLDVSILQDRVLAPLLGIGDPRTDKRIDFIGGIRGMAALHEAVDSGEYAVAFGCYPTSIEELLAIADAGKVMPPKSTWFEPKLKSGLLIHSLE
jgi:uncharacterized protein (DUF1015 family)